MVKGHREAIVMLDGFISTTKNEELKRHLTDARQHVAMHLQKAEQIETDTPATQ